MKRVLSVGQCGADHGSIRYLLSREFGAEVQGSDDAGDALAQLRAGAFDLVLVNRKFDLDGSDGVELIRQIKADTTLAGVPVMLVSNYADAQAEAVAVGAAMGFGKARLTAPETRELLAAVLA
jgi:CheY-like chemotaxis protein